MFLRSSASSFIPTRKLFGVTTEGAALPMKAWRVTVTSLRCDKESCSGTELDTGSKLDWGSGTVTGTMTGSGILRVAGTDPVTETVTEPVPTAWASTVPAITLAASFLSSVLFPPWIGRVSRNTAAGTQTTFITTITP
ncbi:hypothetical protein E2C01_000531 [Portunus trituberculatus]|uniref:Uncharacterized protein n=1 Tax=Portunus trituberculatus TaxID=210409 RepID=A0A5B7CEC2_PORTR|nr:hypothetical protein [Portunus trituberculatus]